MSALRLAVVHVLAMRRRLFALAGLGAVFLLAGAAAALFLRDEHGDVHIDALFLVGGYQAASALLLLGWLLGRLPLIAVLLLMGGIVSGDRDTGLARLGDEGRVLASDGKARCYPVFDLSIKRRAFDRIGDSGEENIGVGAFEMFDCLLKFCDRLALIAQHDEHPGFDTVLPQQVSLLLHIDRVDAAFGGARVRRPAGDPHLWISASLCFSRPARASAMWFAYSPCWPLRRA